MGEEAMSPHIRQRIAFIGALIPDLTSAGWSAISDTWDDLTRETEGTTFASRVQSLQDPIARRDARMLAQAIDDLLKAA